MDAGLTAAFRTHRRVLAVAPTGSGKTVMFAHRAGAVIQNTADRVLILAHRRELIRQAHAKAVAHGVPATIYPSADPGRVMVGSVQTLVNRLAILPRFKRIIVDEAHHSVAGQYRDLLDSQPDAEVEGWTATPERLDGRGLGTVFQAMVEGPTVAELTSDGYLVPAKVYGPPPGGLPDLRGVGSQAGDYAVAPLERAMMRPTLLGSAPEHYEQICPGVRAIAFCVSVKHAMESAAAFRAEGWRFVCVHGGMPQDQRDRAFLDLAAGRISGITSCDLVSEGVDIPDVGCIIMQRPSKSLGMVMQMWGRAARPAPGKTCYYVLDHAGNALRHGFPATPRTWSLDAPKRKAEREVHASQCPECYAFHPPGSVCPSCGYSYRDAAAAAEARKIEEQAGALALLSEDDRRLKELRETPLAVLLKRARTHADLEVIGTARGFHRGWADIRSRFLPASDVAADGGEFV